MLIIHSILIYYLQYTHIIQYIVHSFSILICILIYATTLKNSAVGLGEDGSIGNAELGSTKGYGTHWEYYEEDNAPLR